MYILYVLYTALALPCLPHSHPHPHLWSLFFTTMSHKADRNPP